MDKMLETIYNIFSTKMRDLELGHVLKENELCQLHDLIQMYELLDSKTLSSKEQNQIIEYYDS